jgi:hypothetical protein
LVILTTKVTPGEALTVVFGGPGDGVGASMRGAAGNSDRQCDTHGGALVGVFRNGVSGQVQASLGACKRVRACVQERVCLRARERVLACRRVRACADTVNSEHLAWLQLGNVRCVHRAPGTIPVLTLACVKYFERTGYHPGKCNCCGRKRWIRWQR